MSKTLTGIVSSAKNPKTITVTVHERLTHPIYKKQYSVSKKFRAHDEKNEAREGDKVEIIEHRPMSASKRWNLSRVIEKAKGSEIEIKEDQV